MLVFANAKINLGLRIIEKRPDGYHNLQTVFYPIKIHDVVELINAEKAECLIQGIEIPGNQADNLCLKAFKTLQSEFNLPPQKIALLKNIPIGAGLGGGSADAAFLIKLANQKFNLQLTDGQMESYAKKLGADCAFFIRNKPVYAFAKGDEFEPIHIDLSDKFLTLVTPPIHVSTTEAFSCVKIKQSDISLKELIKLPLKEWKYAVFNDFEETVFQKHREIKNIKEKLYQAGAIFALMSGSGSSVFAIFEHWVKLPELELKNQVFYNI